MKSLNQVTGPTGALGESRVYSGKPDHRPSKFQQSSSILSIGVTTSEKPQLKGAGAKFGFAMSR
jgi:hypothetical protein